MACSFQDSFVDGNSCASLRHPSYGFGRRPAVHHDSRTASARPHAPRASPMPHRSTVRRSGLRSSTDAGDSRPLLQVLRYTSTTCSGELVFQQRSKSSGASALGDDGGRELCGQIAGDRQASQARPATSRNATRWRSSQAIAPDVLCAAADSAGRSSSAQPSHGGHFQRGAAGAADRLPACAVETAVFWPHSTRKQVAGHAGLSRIDPRRERKTRQFAPGLFEHRLGRGQSSTMRHAERDTRCPAPGTAKSGQSPSVLERLLFRHARAAVGPPGKRDAAVDQQRASGNIVAGRIAEKDDAAADLVRPCPAASRAACRRRARSFRRWRIFVRRACRSSPGVTMFTRILCSTSSMAAVRAIWSMAALDML